MMSNEKAKRILAALAGGTQPEPQCPRQGCSMCYPKLRCQDACTFCHPPVSDAAQALAAVLADHRLLLGGGRDSTPDWCSCNGWSATTFDPGESDEQWRLHTADALIRAAAPDNGRLLIGKWLRIMPSGDVHFVNGADDKRGRTRCGIWKYTSVFTADYPPLLQRCARCEATP